LWLGFAALLLVAFGVGGVLACDRRHRPRRRR
jgi:hypothetical protein